MGVNITSRILGEAKDKRLTDPQEAFDYARYVIKGPFPEGEAAIATDTRWSYYYAREVIKGRWPSGEAAIAKDSQDAYYAYYYAKNVIKGRFPEAEESMAKDTKYAKKYLKLFPEAKMEWYAREWIDWTKL